MTCRAYVSRTTRCGKPAAGTIGTQDFCTFHYRLRNAQERKRRDAERLEQRLEQRHQAAKARSPEWGFLADLAANAEVWTREEYERFCKSWHHEFQSHAEGHEPSRARARRNGGKGRTVLLP